MPSTTPKAPLTNDARDALGASDDDVVIVLSNSGDKLFYGKSVIVKDSSSLPIARRRAVRHIEIMDIIDADFNGDGTIMATWCWRNHYWPC